jgi:hypothetical protein
MTTQAAISYYRIILPHFHLRRDQALLRSYLAKPVMGTLWTWFTHHCASHFSHTRNEKQKMYKEPGIVGTLCRQYRTIMQKVVFFLAIVLFIFTYSSEGRSTWIAYTINRN